MYEQHSKWTNKKKKKTHRIWSAMLRFLNSLGFKILTQLENNPQRLEVREFVPKWSNDH